MIYLSSEWRQKLLDAGFPSEELKLGVCEEILRRLPDNIQISVSNYSGLKKRYGILLSSSHGVVLPNGIIAHNDEEDSLANACAATYCYLSDNHLLP